MLSSPSFVFLTITVTFLSRVVDCTTWNRIKRADVTHNWLELGFKFISDSYWTTITTKNKGWTEEVVVFFSLPSFGGSLHSQGKMIGPKMAQKAIQNPDNTYSFTVKLVQANDSFCSKAWSTPTFLGDMQLSWMVVEKGAYYVSNHTFIVGSGDISRVDNSGSATVANGNAVRLDYPVGCEGVMDISCTVTEVTNPLNLGALQQLQTSVNTVDNGRDLYLSVRTRAVNLRHIQLVIFPHSALDPSYYAIRTPEVVAYMVFSNFTFTCLENMVFETHIYESITSLAKLVVYDNTFDYVPGLYGTLGSTVSLIDATTVRSFNCTVSGCYFITQEDQCTTEQTEHTTEERVFAFVVGERFDKTSNFTCNVVFNSAKSTSSPTFEPTALPTIRPSSSPTTTPTKIPTASPTSSPTRLPTVTPTVGATATPTTTCSANQFEVKFTKKARS